MNNISLFFLILGYSFATTFALSALEIEKIGVKDGLSNNNVISITQDREGYIWIGTKNGLNRFDCNSFTVFKTSETAQNALCSNILNSVYADKTDDIIWIASEKSGIDAYNYKTHQFTHYQHDYSGKNPDHLIADGITHITGDDEGNLWLATYQSGIDYYDKKSGKFIHYNQSNVKGLVSDYNWHVLHDQETNQLYVGHVNEGFSIIDIKARTAINFNADPNRKNSLPDNTVTCIFKDSHKNIWVGTRDGLTLFDPETFKMINLRHHPDKPQSLSNNFVKEIIETTNGELWFGTEGGGVSIIELNKLPLNPTSETISFKHIKATDTPDGLSSSSVQSMLQDTYGNIWLGGYIGGINFIANKAPFFKKITYLPYIDNKNSLNNINVTKLSVDNHDNVWIANGIGGINIFNKGTKIKSITSLKVHPEPLDVTTVYSDKQHHIWIGTATGKVLNYNTKTEKFSLITGIPDMTNLTIQAMLVDSRDNLWICTDRGLRVYHISTKEAQAYTTKNSGLSDDVTRTILEDDEGNIWVGTLIGGLCVFNRDFKLLYNYGNYFDFYGVNDLYKDTQGRIWVASQNDLFLFKSHNSDSVIRMGKKDGLTENYISSVIEGESSDNIWLSTTSGISHLYLPTMKFDHFTISDDIVMGDYAHSSVTKTADGTIYMGSQSGISYFSQHLIQTPIEVPKAVITKFAIPNIENKNLAEFIDIPFEPHTELRYNQNSIQISFNVMDYSLADKIEFMCQLSGLDDKWYLLNREMQVTFRNLKPGKYVFNLKTRIHNKAWSEEVTTMSITIAPPLWLTQWAKAIYFLVIVLISALLIRFYKNKLKIENALLFEKQSRRQEKQLNEEKIKFFTNITHELRTPMTLILGPLEDLITDKNIDVALNKKITSIHKVANRLLQLINQILEFRKSETNSRKLTVLKDDFAKHIFDTGLKYKELKTNPDVEYILNLPSQEINMYFDPEVVTIILDNLLSNAFKYTRQGAIKLELTTYNENGVEYAELTVSDTGYGISEKDLPHIFERYYQAKDTTHAVSGTGIGLALVKRMVDLHEADVKVISKQGHGTAYSVRFLTNNTYPDALHLDREAAEPTDKEIGDISKDVILVVDDNPDITAYITDCLTDNFQVMTAENGKTGFEIACNKVPDIVISDIMMPVMDGIEMCKLMKQDVRTSHIPVVLLTAKSSLQDKKEGYDAGADSYLTKPFSGNLLRSRLNNILEARKKLSESNVTTLKDKKQIYTDAASQLDRDFLKQLTTVIEENLEEEEMNIKLIASKMNMSHSTLYRKIKALTNLTANEFIRKVRMQMAEQLLLTNKYTVAEVMYKVGINSNGYFRRCFRDEFGENPSEYLQKLK